METGTFIAVLIYAGIATWQGCLTGHANEIAHDALYAQQRPWVGVDDPKGGLNLGPVSIDDKFSAQVAFEPVLKNFGNYPAQDAFTFAHLVLAGDRGDFLDDVGKAEQSSCLSRHSWGIGNLIFPGQTSFPNAIQAAPMQIPEPLRTKMVQAFVVACIIYQDQFKSTYYTVVIYELMEPPEVPSGTTRPVHFAASPGKTAGTGVWDL